MKTSASGKIIIFGEHSVVYGSHALIAPLSEPFIWIEAVKSDNKGVTFYQNSNKYKVNLTLHDENLGRYPDELVERTLIAILRGIKSKLDLDELPDLHITMASDVPTGGLGGSTAFITAVVDAILKILDAELSLDEKYNLVVGIERDFQGNVSGADTAAIVYRKPIVFHREKGVIKRLSLEKKIKLMIINSGKINKDTGKLIEWVTENNSKETLQNFVIEIDEVINQALSDLENANHSNMAKYIQIAEDWLEKINIVTQDTKNLIKDITELGGSAKVSGAGTRGSNTGGSGAVICYAEEYSKIEKYLDGKGLEYFYTTI